MSVVQNVLSEIKDLKSPEKFDSQKLSSLEHIQDSDSSSNNEILRDCVRSVLTDYINDLKGHSIENLYQLVLAEVETPLLETILEHTNGNQSKAAQMLGINRGTLRKKLKQYNISE